jgi:hypothetical protein
MSGAAADLLAAYVPKLMGISNLCGTDTRYFPACLSMVLQRVHTNTSAISMVLLMST